MATRTYTSSNETNTKKLKRELQTNTHLPFRLRIVRRLRVVGRSRRTTAGRGQPRHGVEGGLVTGVTAAGGNRRRGVGRRLIALRRRLSRTLSHNRLERNNVGVLRRARRKQALEGSTVGVRI